jgi:acetyltransferase-like isoleucine patch superfamily enzyme
VRRIFQFTGGRPGRLLDVDCGRGFFIKACVTSGIDAEGVDLSETAVVPPGVVAAGNPARVIKQRL